MKLKVNPDIIKKIILENMHKTDETAGLLVGVKKDKILKITDILQTESDSTPFSVAVNLESQIKQLERLKEYKGKVICGWYHTHPSMGSDFLSSTDIKTQSAYQAVFPESVALVVDPVRFKTNQRIDTKVFCFYQVDSGKPKPLKFQLDITPNLILENILKNEILQAGKAKLNEFNNEKHVRHELIRKHWVNMLTAILGWITLLLMILFSVLFVIIIA